MDVAISPGISNVTFSYFFRTLFAIPRRLKPANTSELNKSITHINAINTLPNEISWISKNGKFEINRIWRIIWKLFFIFNWV